MASPSARAGASSRTSGQAFDFLQRAADLSSAVAPEFRADAGGPVAVVGSEVVVAILELAQSHLHGWGCKKDPVKALSTFLVAARLGDPDAMVAAACRLETGLGCPGGKKDRREAAFWYRAAIGSGHTIAHGLDWVYKKKWAGGRG